MRCAACGSTRVFQEYKKEGYNLKKGIIEAALFGSVGTLAGTTGNEVIYYHCTDCGQTLNRCMDEVELLELKFALDTQGMSDDCFIERTKRMMQRYPNAGWNVEKINNVQNNISTLKDNSGITTKEDYNDTVTRDNERLLNRIKKYLEQYTGSVSMNKLLEAFPEYSSQKLKFEIKKASDINIINSNGEEYIKLCNEPIGENQDITKIEKEESDAKITSYNNNMIKELLLMELEKFPNGANIEELMDNKSIAKYSKLKISLILKNLSNEGKVKIILLERGKEKLYKLF